MQPDPTPTGPALDAMAERAAAASGHSGNLVLGREIIAYALTGRTQIGPERDAVLVAILARLAEPPTCKDGLQVAAPGDFEPAGRAIFVRLGASTIDAFHPAYERNADLFEGAARDAIAFRPGAAPGDGRLREAVVAYLAALDARARHDDEQSPDDDFGLIHVGETLGLDDEVERTRIALDAAFAQTGQAASVTTEQEWNSQAEIDSLTRALDAARAEVAASALREKAATSLNGRAIRALLMCASHCQGGHSDAGHATSDLLDVPFPLTMEALATKAKALGYDQDDLWPWYGPMVAARTTEKPDGR